MRWQGAGQGYREPGQVVTGMGEGSGRTQAMQEAQGSAGILPNAQ